MKFSTKSRAKLMTLAGALVFSVAGTGIVHAGGCCINYYPSGDTTSSNTDESIEERWAKWNKKKTELQPKPAPNTTTQDTALTGRKGNDDDAGNSGTGPKLPSRY
jgi:hypothetical protein